MFTKMITINFNSKQASFLLFFLQNDPIRIGYQEYACPICPKISKRKDYMQKHILTHTGEKPYACPKCNYACTSSNNLHRHIRNIHKILDYEFPK